MQKTRANPALRIWLRLIPYFLSATLFLSGIFSVFAPMPLIVLGVVQSLPAVLAAAFVNSAIVYFARGPAFFQFYLIGVASLGLLIPFFLVRKKRSLEQTTAGAWMGQMLALVGLVCVYAAIRGVSPLEEVKLVTSNLFDLMIRDLAPATKDQLLAEFTLEEWKQKVMIEFPPALMTVGLVMTWVNLYLLLSLNPGRVLSKLGFDRKTFYQWKTSEWLVWPTIAAWAVFILSEGTVSELALGFCKVFMAIYAIQGLAILATVFDAWRIRGFLRLFIIMIVLFVMMPLLLSIGFFDQWFDFRAKIRQSS